MSDAWRKSSYSGNGGDCVEVADHHTYGALRRAVCLFGVPSQREPVPCHELLGLLRNGRRIINPIAATP